MFLSFLVSCVCVSVVQALLTSSGQDRSTGLEAHMVSANSRYIEEQQEQQQVETYKQEETAGRQEAGRKRKKGEVLVISVVFWFYTLDLNLSLKVERKVSRISFLL